MCACVLAACCQVAGIARCFDVLLQAIFRQSAVWLVDVFYSGAMPAGKLACPVSIILVQ
jgi:hypothetical protein